MDAIRDERAGEVVVDVEEVADRGPASSDRPREACQ
jgi:hypothetical protein